VTSGDRRLAALAAALAPADAPRIISRGRSPACAAETARLAALPRTDRLAALAAALAVPAAAADRHGSQRAERPRIASLLSDVGGGRTARPGVSPLLLRVIRERTA
jgi:hypothetical protein